MVFRNLHAGKEQHIFHLHNHQWLFNPNDDNSNYLDAQGVGPGSGYTYEINYGGSGNRNKTVGDAIFHCHFYPHFAQGMWEHWRIHDAFEAGTKLAVSGGGYHTTAVRSRRRDAGGGRPGAAGRGDRRRHADPGGGAASRPAMAPMPGEVTVKANPDTTVAAASHPDTPGQQVPVGSLADVRGPHQEPRLSVLGRGYRADRRPASDRRRRLIWPRPPRWMSWFRRRRRARPPGIPATPSTPS